MFEKWLLRRASVCELEAEHLVNGVPFGFCNTEWEALKAKIQLGDEVWTFSSPQEDWDLLMGWEGIALVRAGEIADFFVTAQN
jgi:hypothetical protein